MKPRPEDPVDIMSKILKSVTDENATISHLLRNKSYQAVASAAYSLVSELNVPLDIVRFISSFRLLPEVISYTPGTLMTSATADVINHNGRKSGQFKPIRFFYARMTSAQPWSRRHHWFEPMSSLSIFKVLYLVICKTLALIFPVQLKQC